MGLDRWDMNPDLPYQLRNFFRRGVPQLAQAFDLVDDTFPFRIDPLECLDIEGKALVGKPFTGSFEVFAQIVEIQHDH